MSDLSIGDEVGYSDEYLAIQKEWRAQELAPKRAIIEVLTDENSLLTLRWHDENQSSKCHIGNVQIVRPK